MSPASVTNERCVVTISPMRPSSGGNLLAEADSVFRDVYRQYDLRNMTTRGSPMPNSIVHGVSGQGWEYVIIRRGVAPRGSPESRLGFVFVAKLESRLAVISGVSKTHLSAPVGRVGAQCLAPILLQPELQKLERPRSDSQRAQKTGWGLDVGHRSRRRPDYHRGATAALPMPRRQQYDSSPAMKPW